jgi:hypothetical protein
MTEKEYTINRREYPRVDTHLPFAVRLVPPEERDSIWCRRSGNTIFELSSMEETEDKALLNWLKMLNVKLDLILSMLTLHNEGFCSLPMKPVIISGGGMCFPTKEKFDMGDLLEIKVMIPLQQPMALYIYGEVIQAQEQPDGYETGVKFVGMDDEIREEIVNFVFQRERQILRERREALPL